MEWFYFEKHQALFLQFNKKQQKTLNQHVRFIGFISVIKLSL